MTDRESVICQADPWNAPDNSGHIHVCKREVDPGLSKVPGAEHECECGMTWIDTPGRPAIFKYAGDKYWTERPGVRNHNPLIAGFLRFLS